MITRRNLLAGLGLGAGAALLGPFFQRAFAQDSGSTPKRLVLFVEGNGVEPVTWLADSARTAINAHASGAIDGKRWWYRSYDHDTVLDVPSGDLAAARSLAPLGASAGPSLVADAAVLYGLSNKVAGGGHTTYQGALTCSKCTSGRPGGISIDAYLGAQPGIVGDRPFDVLRLGVGATTSAVLHGVCAYGAGRTAPVLLDPVAAYTNLFGAVAAGDVQRAFRERGEILDFAAEDVKRALAVFSGGSDERAKLEAYLTSLETVSARQKRLVEMEGTLRSVAPPSPDERAWYSSTDPMERLAAHTDVATAALVGGLTNLVVLTSGAGGPFSLNYGALSMGIGRHDLHHGSAGNAEYRDAIHNVTQRHVELLAGMARTLAAIPEGSGSMLDHTIILYTSDNGEQHHSTASEWPMLLIGGSALGLVTGGRTVVYPGLGKGAHRQVSNLYNPLGHLLGAPVDDFGAEGASRVAEGPLAELMG